MHNAIPFAACRLVNTGGDSSINLDEVQLQYWFDATLVRVEAVLLLMSMFIMYHMFCFAQVPTFSVTCRVVLNSGLEVVLVRSSEVSRVI